MATNHKDQHNFEAGLKVEFSTANITVPPTDAELDSAFGTPASKGGAWLGVVDDNGAETNTYLVWSTGTKWAYIAGTFAI